MHYLLADRRRNAKRLIKFTVLVFRSRNLFVNFKQFLISVSIDIVWSVFDLDIEHFLSVIVGRSNADLASQNFFQSQFENVDQDLLEPDVVANEILR